MTRYVLGFMFDQDHKKVLLVEKTSPAWQAGKFNGVGGKLEDGERAVDAMVREFREETGIATDEWDWEYRLDIKSEVFQVLIYMAEGRIDLARKTSVKDSPVRFPVNELPPNQLGNLRWIVPFLLDRPDIIGTVIYP